MCGIVGIVDAGGVSLPLYYALYALQHRGQESAGISVFDGDRLRKHKGQGLVAEVFDTEILRGLNGTVGVGHVRYPTTGANLPENIQPFNFEFLGRSFALAHNGNLVNTRELRAAYEQAGQIFCTSTDTEVIANLIADELRHSGSIEDAVRSCMAHLRGSYSVVMVYEDQLYAFRDPLGLKPLCVGTTPGGYIVASESVAIDALSGTLIRDVAPGELVRIDADGITSTQIAVADRAAHCIFEYVYFARADSIIDGVLVYDVRRRIGQKLFEEAPDSGGLGLPGPGLRHGLCDRVLRGVWHTVPRGADEEPVHGPDLHHADAGCARTGRADQAEPDQKAPRGQVDRAGRRLDRARHDLAPDRPAGPGRGSPRGPPAGRLAADQGPVLPRRGHADP